MWEPQELGESGKLDCKPGGNKSPPSADNYGGKND